MDALIDAEVLKTATIASGLVIADGVIDTIASDLIIMDALVDAEVIKTVTIASDLVVMDALIDAEVIKTVTIASDLVVMDALIDAEVIKTVTIASDLVVMDALIDAEVTKTATIASDLVITNAIIDAQPRCVVKTGGTIPSGDDALFTVVGTIRCKITGVLTPNVVGGSVNGKLTFTTDVPSATVDLSNAAVAMDNDPAGTIYQHVGATAVFTPTTTLGYAKVDPVSVEETEFILTDGLIEFVGDAAQSGTIVWSLTYWPMTPTTTVTIEA